jgi:stage V sporulation protein B
LVQLDAVDRMVLRANKGYHEMKDKQTTTKGFVILSAAGIINKFLALVYLPIQTYFVHNYGNGIINTGYTIYIFMFALSNAGIPTAISKLISEQNAKENYTGSQRILKVAGIIMISFGIFFGSLMALGAHAIANFNSQPKAYLMILALSPALLFTSISSILRGYFQGKLNMIPTALSQVVEQALNTVFTIAFIAILIKYGIEAAAAGSAIGTSAGAMGAALFLYMTFRKNKKCRDEEIRGSKYTGGQITYKYILKQIASYSVPAILGIIAINLNNLIDLKLCVDRLMAGGYQYVTATESYGILTNQYQKIINVPLAITATLPVALIPAISVAAAMKDMEILKRKIVESFKAILLIVIPSAVILSVLAKPIIAFVFFSYDQGSDLMMTGSWVIIINAVIYLQTAVLIGIGKPHLPPVNLIVSMVIKTAISYFLIAIPSINVKGAVIGTMLGYSAACILNYFSLKKHVKIEMNYGKLILKPAVASVIMGGSAYVIYHVASLLLKNIINSGILLNDISVLFAVILGASIYLIILILLKTLNKNDLSKLPLGTKLIKYLMRSKILHIYL